MVTVDKHVATMANKKALFVVDAHGSCPSTKFKHTKDSFLSKLTNQFIVLMSRSGAYQDNVAIFFFFFLI